MAFGEIDSPHLSESGHHRLQCRVTGQWFWSRDPSRETCGDTVEDEYTFIGAPIIPGFEGVSGRALKDAMRERFLDFFESREHSRMDPYPVIARWRDDIHLTIASIADFQPHVTDGSTPPPHNPLTISQPCIRLTDVAAVGRSGRHLTTFEMMAHHCFNRPEDEDIHYWIDECIAFCDELFTEELGINPDSITYVENPWSGGGNAGPAVEVIAGGLELATLVFMNLEEREDGDVEIKGIRYDEMPLQIIDTGYGLERFCWAAAGTPTIYDAIYPETVAWLRDLSGFDATVAALGIDDIDGLMSELSRSAGILNIDVGTDAESLYETLVERLAERGTPIPLATLKEITEPLASIFAIPDHMHALCNMLGDALVPSNAKAGYLARMMARRVCRMKDELGIDTSLAKLGEHHIQNHLSMDGFEQTEDGVLRILELEEARYREMLDRGEAAVKTALRGIPKDSSEVPDEVLHRLAEERGLQPDMVVRIAGRLGWQSLSIRVGFSADMAARHAANVRAAADSTNKPLSSLTEGLPETHAGYYDDEGATSFTSPLIACIPLDHSIVSSLHLSPEVEGEPTHSIVLESTLFYPEGGGQLGDQGTISGGNSTVRVVDTRVEGGVIVHLCDGPLPGGDVQGELDSKRRRQMMDHHSSVHVIGGSARAILGPHIWQAGSSKGARYARLDITHHGRLTQQEIRTIEEHANSVVASATPITKQLIPREEADARYGFTIYQGGPPKHRMIRVVTINGHDVQACAGTHHPDTGKIGTIRLVRASQVQDGVERLHLLAGDAAAEHSKRQEALLMEAAGILDVQPEALPRAVKRFYDEWRDQRRRIERLEADVMRLRTDGGGESVERDGIRYVVMESDGDLKAMQRQVAELTRDPSRPTIAVIGSREDGGKILVAITEDSIATEAHDAVDILRTIAPHIGGGGGGRPSFAQGGGSNGEGLNAALDAAREMLGT